MTADDALVRAGQEIIDRIREADGDAVTSFSELEDGSLLVEWPSNGMAFNFFIDGDGVELVTVCGGGDASLDRFELGSTDDAVARAVSLSGGNCAV